MPLSDDEKARIIEKVRAEARAAAESQIKRDTARENLSKLAAQNQAAEARGRETKQIGLGCFLFIIAFAVFYSMWSSSRRAAPPEPEKPSFGSQSLNLSARATGFSLTFENKDNFPYSNVEIEVNPPGVFSSGYKTTVTQIAPGQTKEIPLTELAKSDGTRYDPLTVKLLEVNLTCDTPKGEKTGFWAGKFNP